MSAPMPLVLGASAVIASPVARLLYDGDLSLDAALVRVALVVSVVWVLLSVAGSLVFSPAPRRTPADEPREAPPVEKGDQSG